jgi:hypothetical protein
MRIRSPHALSYHPRPTAFLVPAPAAELLDLAHEVRALIEQTEIATALGSAVLRAPLVLLDPALYALHHRRSADAVRRLQAWDATRASPPRRRVRVPWAIRHTPVVTGRLLDLTDRIARLALRHRWLPLTARGAGSLADDLMGAVHELARLAGLRAGLLSEPVAAVYGTIPVAALVALLHRAIEWDRGGMAAESRSWPVQANALVQAARLTLGAEVGLAGLVARRRAVGLSPRLAAVVAEVHAAAEQTLCVAGGPAVRHARR